MQLAAILSVRLHSKAVSIGLIPNNLVCLPYRVVTPGGLPSAESVTAQSRRDISFSLIVLQCCAALLETLGILWASSLPRSAISLARAMATGPDYAVRRLLSGPWHLAPGTWHRAPGHSLACRASGSARPRHALCSIFGAVSASQDLISPRPDRQRGSNPEGMDTVYRQR